ncbi:MAG: phosphopyruvate hydratase [bacterium]
MNKKIETIVAREILDSRGNPTVAVELVIKGGFLGISAVPSGASTGKYEAVELRDGDMARYKGQGVLKAVQHVNTTIRKAIVGKRFDQRLLDNLLLSLDGTPNKANLGANAILGVSMAFARAAAAANKQELYVYLNGLSKVKMLMPQPMFNIINGGKHADSGLDIQEFMLIPVNFPNFHEKLRVASEVFHTLKSILSKQGFKTSVGDEGGFAPELKSNEQALDLIVLAIKKAGYATDDVKIGLDAAASSFYNTASGLYELKIAGVKKSLKSAAVIAWYQKLLKKYPIITIEDGLAEDDWTGFRQLTEKLGDQVSIIGDDLLVTNIIRIKQAITEQAVNSVLIKLNQIGSVSETIDAITLAQSQKWLPCMSHRSGETEDTFIADMAVGLGCPMIKSGSLSRGERICKYNRLLRIEDNIKK